MIRTDRDRRDETGRWIRPDAAWFAAAAAATNRALAQGKTHVADRNIYAHEEVRKALEELFHRKCAYCEISTARVDWEVEHYRPKGRVAERQGHPGYYWLAYDWDNLFPSCTFCNQHRK